MVCILWFFLCKLGERAEKPKNMLVDACVGFSGRKDKKWFNNSCLWVVVLLFILFLTTMFEFSNHVHALFGGGKCQKSLCLFLFSSYFSICLKDTTTENVEQLELSCIGGGNAKWYNHFGKQHGSFLKKIKNSLPYDPAIPLLGITQEK